MLFMSQTKAAEIGQYTGPLVFVRNTLKSQRVGRRVCTLIEEFDVNFQHIPEELDNHMLSPEKGALPIGRH